MDKPKWTPGPWTVDGEPWNRIIWSSAENRVCFMAHSNGLDDDRDIATSNLIAAAPDLYAALDQYVKFMENTGFSSRFLDKGRDALAKARGTP